MAYIALAGIGIEADMSLILMIIGCAFALASWDLIHFKQSKVGNPFLKTKASMEKNHLQSLALAVFTGLLLAFLGSMIHLRLAFGVIVLLVLMAVGGIVYGLRIFMKKDQLQK
jgi:hypothetical protein